MKIPRVTAREVERIVLLLVLNSPIVGVATALTIEKIVDE